MTILLAVFMPISLLQAEETSPFSVNEMFDKLYANEIASRQINDSLFVPMEKDEWISTFLRRAQLNGAYFEENETMLRQFRKVLASDTLSQQTIINIFNRFRRYSLNQVNNDPFLAEEINLALTRQVNKLDMSVADNIDMKTELQRMLADNEYQISLFGDTAALKQCYLLYRDLADNYDPRDTLYHSTVAGTQLVSAVYSMFSTPEFGRQDLVTTDELRHYLDLYQRYQGDSSVFVNVSDPAFRYIPYGSQTAESYRISKEFHFFRNIFWPNPKMFAHEIDSVSQLVLDYYNKHPLPHTAAYEPQLRHLLNIRYTRGQLTDQMLLDSLCRYRKDFFSDNVSGGTIINYFNNVMKCVSIIHGMDIPESAKHDSVAQYSELVINTLRGLKGNFYNSSLLYSMSIFATHGAMHQHLTTPERKHYLESMLFYTQPFTRAHCETVSALALIILRAVLDYRPDLLVGVMGYDSKKQILKHRQEIIDYFTEGARYHDLGKNRMPYIIVRDTRALTDHEFALIKRHPEFGLSYLKVDSSMLRLHDIVVGHHKWYNGKGGYPAWFDNRSSSDAVLIDILTLGDCLEAATSRLGRNYRKNKRYEDLEKEFVQDAGTRYNPDVVQLILDHPEVADQLRQMTAEGWKDIYYNSFKNITR